MNPRLLAAVILVCADKVTSCSTALLGLPCQELESFHLPVMGRIAISTPNVMAALRHLRHHQARPYNFALSPVLVTLTGNQITLLAPFEKKSSRWMTMPHINILTE